MTSIFDHTRMTPESYKTEGTRPLRLASWMQAEFARVSDLTEGHTIYCGANSGNGTAAIERP